MIDDATIKRVAEEVGFFRGSGITGGWVGKGNSDNPSADSVFSFARAIEQLARQEQREEDARICELEKVDAKATGEHEDEVYNLALDHASYAIRAA